VAKQLGASRVLLSTIELVLVKITDRANILTTVILTLEEYKLLCSPVRNFLYSLVSSFLKISYSPVPVAALRQGLSWPAPTLMVLVRILLKAWVLMYVYSVSMLSCV
jgi:hypothetical protein